MKTIQMVTIDADIALEEGMSFVKTETGIYLVNVIAEVDPSEFSEEEVEPEPEEKSKKGKKEPVSEEKSKKGKKEPEPKPEEDELTAEMLNEMDREEMIQLIDENDLGIKYKKIKDDEELREKIAEAVGLDLENNGGEEGGEMSFQDLVDMNRDELEDLIDEKNLDVDPDDDDFEKDDALRIAIAEELEIEVPKKSKKR